MRYVVTGANRGIGLELVRQLVARGAQVFALCRQPDAATALQELRAAHGDLLTVLALDVSIGSINTFFPPVKP